MESKSSTKIHRIDDAHIKRHKDFDLIHPKEEHEWRESCFGRQLSHYSKVHLPPRICNNFSGVEVISADNGAIITAGIASFGLLGPATRIEPMKFYAAARPDQMQARQELRHVHKFSPFHNIC